MTKDKDFQNGDWIKSWSLPECLKCFLFATDPNIERREDVGMQFQMLQQEHKFSAIICALLGQSENFIFWVLCQGALNVLVCGACEAAYNHWLSFRKPLASVCGNCLYICFLFT